MAYNVTYWTVVSDTHIEHPVYYLTDESPESECRNMKTLTAEFLFRLSTPDFRLQTF